MVMVHVAPYVAFAVQHNTYAKHRMGWHGIVLAMPMMPNDGIDIRRLQTTNEREMDW